MAETTRKASKERIDAPGGDGEAVERMAAMNGVAGEILAEAMRAYLEGVTAWNEELMSFARLRMDRDMELSEALSKCDSWRQAAELQQSWMQQTTEAYMAEAGKLMELASTTATQRWAPVYERANKAMEELRPK